MDFVTSIDSSKSFDNSFFIDLFEKWNIFYVPTSEIENFVKNKFGRFYFWKTWLCTYVRKLSSIREHLVKYTNYNCFVRKHSTHIEIREDTSTYRLHFRYLFSINNRINLIWWFHRHRLMLGGSNRRDQYRIVAKKQRRTYCLCAYLTVNRKPVPLVIIRLGEPLKTISYFPISDNFLVVNLLPLISKHVVRIVKTMFVKYIVQIDLQCDWKDSNVSWKLRRRLR